MHCQALEIFLDLSVFCNDNGLLGVPRDPSFPVHRIKISFGKKVRGVNSDVPRKARGPIVGLPFRDRFPKSVAILEIISPYPSPLVNSLRRQLDKDG